VLKFTHNQKVKFKPSVASIRAQILTEGKTATSQPLAKT